MASENTNLKAVLREVVGETVTPQKPKDTKPDGVSEATSGETKTGETPEYVGGIDISDIPVEDRARMKPHLEKKLKLLEKGYQDKFKEVATFKKAQDDLVGLGLSVDEAKTVLAEHIERKKRPDISADKKEVKKTLDTLIDNAPPEQRESLRQLRTILNEETDVDTLRKEVSELKSVLKSVSGGYTDVRKKELEKDVEGLKGKYGDLVDKYHDVLIDESLKYNVSPLKVLYNRAEEAELEQAIYANKSKQSRTKEKVDAIASTGTGVNSSSETINTKGKWADTIRQVIKSKGV